MTQKRILYVEDNPQNQRLVRKILTAKGYAIIEAVDGPGGLETALRECPDLILMDINLPGIDGLEVTRRLRESAIAHTPIIALTANAMRGDREKVLESGCSEYIQKPVSSATLVEMVYRFIGSAEADIASIPQPTTQSSVTQSA
jgi:CheY-like chemotaxis protein